MKTTAKMLLVVAFAAGTLTACKSNDTTTEETMTETTTMEQDTMATPAPVAPEVPGDTTTMGTPTGTPPAQ